MKILNYFYNYLKYKTFENKNFQIDVNKLQYLALITINKICSYSVYSSATASFLWLMHLKVNPDLKKWRGQEKDHYLYSIKIS